jgi:hypothetical protein
MLDKRRKQTGLAEDLEGLMEANFGGAEPRKKNSLKDRNETKLVK